MNRFRLGYANATSKGGDHGNRKCSDTAIALGQESRVGMWDRCRTKCTKNLTAVAINLDLVHPLVALWRPVVFCRMRGIDETTKLCFCERPE